MPVPQDFARIGAAGAAAFSRDGTRLFHLRGAGLAQVWAMELSGGAARQLTFHDEKVAFLRRSPVDDRLIYGIDRGGDERQQLFLLDPAAPDPQPLALTDDPAVIHDFGGWSPDGARIAFAANARDEARFEVFVQDLATGERHCVLSAAAHGAHIVSVAGWRADGGRLAVVVDRGYGDMSVLTVDPTTCETRGFPHHEPANWQSVRWSGDGASLLALTDHGSNHPRLCRLDPDCGAITVVYEASGRDVEAWAISSDQSRLATTENDRGWSVLRVGATEAERPELAVLRGVLTEPTFSPDGSRLAFTAATPTEPPGLWLIEDGTVRPLYRPDPAAAGIAADSLVEPQLVGWAGLDGRDVPGWLFLPPGPGPHPAVVWVHGGPVGQARPNFRPDMQMLVAQGFAVLMPNVRGSSGYGRAGCESDDRDRRLDSVADLAAGARWLAAHPAVDGDRIGLMGQSYGGFMVLSAITEYPELWKAAVDYYGIADFVTLLGGTGTWRRAHRAAEYGDPERDAALFARISPIHRVDRVTAPLLVLHGTRDPRVPIDESEQFVAALRERQKPLEYLVFDYAGHGFIRPDDKERAYAAVAAFFGKWL
ncbi:MAG TPA: S9 family peptidase [Acetobacteraceae bacterium]|nr:S9 family peptidase [Acetobacteraceae bacterium]